MPKITLEHIGQAVEWAKTAQTEAQPLDRCARQYNQTQWDCQTSCCIWGAASIIAGNGPATTGPQSAWGAQSGKHRIVAALLNSGQSTPEQFAIILANDLSGADLRGADLRGANLRGANLRGANLSDANLRDADLSGADLRGANLSDADLSGADLRGANLRGADLRDAGLRGANLSDANLRDADLSGADLRGANLSDADLSGAAVLVGNVYRKVQ